MQRNQPFKVRNVLSEVFVDPMPTITLFRSLKINIGRRRKMQAAPKMITYLYKVVCFFSYKETFNVVILAIVSSAFIFQRFVEV